jgi:2-methylcitrate dehydratase PrpD
MSYTEKIVEYIYNSKKEEIPKEVIEHTKIFILDSLGCLIGGYCTKAGKQIVEQAKEFKGAGEGSILCEGTKVSLPFACWANCCLANILDMDDVYAGTAHQGNLLVPSSLVIGEEQKASGIDVIHAIVLGFEVGSRIMKYCWPSPSKARTYFPSTWQVFDAVTVTGKLLGMKKKEIFNAFGLAGTVPPLPIDMKKFVERPMGFSKNPFGWTNFTGIFWTLMAQKGAQGTPHILDGDAGFWAIMGSDNCDFDKLVEGLGEKFNILETKYKPYPLCTWGHVSLDATKKIFEENNIFAKDICSVKIKTIARAVDFLSDSKMETIYDSQFSLPHAVAMLSLRKKPGPEWMSEENMFHNSEAKSVAEKVKMEVDQGAEEIFFKEDGMAIPTHVPVKTVDGKIYEEKMKYSKGTPLNPFKKEELIKKFKTLASNLYDTKKINEIIEVVESFDKVDDVSIIAKMLNSK